MSSQEATELTAQKTKTLEKAQITAQAAKKAADDVNAKYLDVSGRLERFEKMLADLTARNDAPSSAAASSGSGQGYSPRFIKCTIINPKEHCSCSFVN